MKLALYFHPRKYYITIPLGGVIKYYIPRNVIFYYVPRDVIFYYVPHFGDEINLHFKYRDSTGMLKCVKGDKIYKDFCKVQKL